MVTLSSCSCILGMCLAAFTGHQLAQGYVYASITKVAGSSASLREVN